MHYGTYLFLERRAYNLIYACLDIVGCGCPVGHAYPHCGPALPYSRAAPENPAPLDFVHNRPCFFRRAKRNQNLIQHDLIQNFEPVACKTSCERLSLVAASCYHIRDTIPPKAEKCCPNVDTPCTPRRFRGVVRGFAIGLCVSGGQASGVQCHGGTQVIRFSNKNDPIVIGNVEPLVPIGSPRIRVGHTLGTEREFRMCKSPKAKGAIDMDPCTGGPSPPADDRCRVEIASVDVACLPAFCHAHLWERG